LCIGKRVSGQTGHLFWDRGSTLKDHQSSILKKNTTQKIHQN
jgi:hypothetical protein